MYKAEKKVSNVRVWCSGSVVVTAMLFLAIAASVSAEEIVLPTLEPLKTNISPKIDGLLDDACWQQAQPIENFWLLDGSAMHDDVAWAKVSYDEDNLYIAYRMPADKKAEWPQGSTRRDEGVWFSPNVQIFIQPTLTSGYYIFTLNSRNIQEDAKNYVTTWNCKWDSAVFIASDRSYWQVELAIPFAVFDLSDNPGQCWRFNLTCNHITKDDKGYILTWAPTFGNFHAPKFFGNLILKNNKWSMRESQFDVQTEPGQAGTFDVEFKFNTVKNLGKGWVVTYMTTPSGSVEEKKQPVFLKNAFQTVKLELPTKEQGAHEFHVKLQTKDGFVLAERQTTAHTPPIFDAWLNRSLYTNERTAQLTVKSWHSEMAGKKCKIVITNSNSETQGEPIITKFDSNFGATAEINLQNIAVGDYEVVVLPLDRVKDMQDKEYAKCTLRKLAPKAGTVSSNDRGVIEVDQKPFFPFGIYYIQNFLDVNDLLAEYADAGFNTIVWEWTSAEGYVRALEKMKPYGIHLITSIQNEGGARHIQDQYWQAEGEKKQELEQAYYKHIAGVVKHVIDSNPTNLLAWYIQDEPSIEILPFVSQSSDVVGGVDLRRPRLVVPCHSIVFRDYAPVVDILAPDAYPGFPDGPMTKVSDFIDAAREAVNGRKPVIAVLQSFGEPGGPGCILPTPEELRCMSYLAIVHQASGIVYFAYSYNGPMREANPAQWQELKKMAGEVRDLTPALAQTAGSLSVNQSDGTSQVHTRIIQHGDTAYIIAVNTLRRPINKVKWQATGLKNGDLEVMWENRKIKVKCGKFSDDFEPLAVHLYRQKTK